VKASDDGNGDNNHGDAYCNDSGGLLLPVWRRLL